MDTSFQLNPEELSAALSSGGAFSTALSSFEAREEQISMLKDVCNAFNQQKISLIEAGTGTGKSLAYLIPSIVLAWQSGKKVAVSTNTINLQEQLMQKDIPEVLQTLGIDIRACLVKGMRNYVCLRRLAEACAESRLFDEDDTPIMEKLQKWVHVTEDGTRTDISFSLPHSSWEKVCAESDTCNKEKCPYYQQCFFYKARKEAEEAKILVLNHSLLFSDLSLRAFYDLSLLPSFSYLVLDEAHNVEDVATDHLSKKAGITQIVKILARLSSEKGPKIAGKLPMLAKKLSAIAEDNFSYVTYLQKIKGDLFAQKQRILTLAFELFEELSNLLEKNNQTEQKLRILAENLSCPLWENARIHGNNFSSETKRFCADIAGLCQELAAREQKELSGLLVDIKALVERLRMIAKTIEELLQSPVCDEKVRWVEQAGGAILGGIQLVEANVEVNELLPEALFKQFDATILVSATLATANSFSYTKERLGLVSPYFPKESVIEALYPSPFNYEKQSAFIVPANIALPDAPEFYLQVQDALLLALAGSKGAAFILFTSYSMLFECYKNLKQKLEKNGHTLFRQGEASRSHLLESFRKSSKGILFGTDSFWEGVDVAGEALRLVVIVKLPFKVPSEPLQQARCQLLIKRGKEPFFSYSLPQAVIKFKQGHGRLIRHRDDRGVVLCLDRRITQKQYGKQFLRALPSCQILQPEVEELELVMASVLRSQREE